MVNKFKQHHHEETVIKLIKTSFKDADDVLILEHGNLNTINLFQQGHSHQIFATGLVKDNN